MNTMKTNNTVDVIREIKNAHNKLVAHELPLLDQLTQNALRTADPDNIELREVRKIFEKLLSQLSAHLNRESREVFPVILRHEVDRAQLSDAVVSVTDMITEHDGIVDLFAQLRQITNQYRPEFGMSFESNLAYEKLAEFEKAALNLIRFETDQAYAGFVGLTAPTFSQLA